MLGFNKLSKIFKTTPILKYAFIYCMMLFLCFYVCEDNSIPQYVIGGAFVLYFSSSAERSFWFQICLELTVVVLLVYILYKLILFYWPDIYKVLSEISNAIAKVLFLGWRELRPLIKHLIISAYRFVMAVCAIFYLGLICVLAITYRVIKILLPILFKLLNALFQWIKNLFK